MSSIEPMNFTQETSISI